MVISVTLLFYLGLDATGSLGGKTARNGATPNQETGDRIQETGKTLHRPNGRIVNHASHRTRPEPGGRLAEAGSGHGTVVLGREPDAWNVPWEPFLARRHAELTLQGGRLKVRRLAAAANPVFHAGKPADSFELQPGGAFVIGRTVFTLADPSTRPLARRPATTAPLLEARTVMHHELDRLAFRDAPHRLDVLSRLPGRDLQRHRRRRPVRPARATCCWPASAGPTRSRARRRPRRCCTGTAAAPARATFEPSRRLVAEAVAKQKQTVLHVWGADADRGRGDDPFTLQGRFDWAFCTPVVGEACPGWGLYVAGRFAGAAASTLLAPWESNELRDDVKFAELVADILGSLRQVQVLRERQGVFRRFFSPGVLNVLSGGDAPHALEPREADVTVLFCDLRGFSKTVEERRRQLLDVLNRVERRARA